MRVSLRAGTLGLVLVCIACDRESASLPALEPVPEPGLASAEPSVIELLEARRDRIRRSEGRPAVDLATAYGELAFAYHAYDLFDAAEAAYTNATRLDSSTYEWWYGVALTHTASGDFDRAAIAFEQALALRPGDLLTLLRLADTEWQRGDQEATRALCWRILEIDEENAVAHYLLGQLASADQDWSLAATHYERALEIQPWASTVRYPLALAYQRLGRTSDARAQMVRRGTRQPSAADPFFQRLDELRKGTSAHMFAGAHALRGGNLDVAIREFSLVTESQPTNASARLNLGTALARARRYDEARPEFEAVLELEISAAIRAKAHFNLGVLADIAGDRTRAIDHFRATLLLEPDNEQVRNRLRMLEGAADAP